MDLVEERWAYLAQLDDELLRGGVILPEWCAMIVRHADLAYVHGAFLASILTAVSAIETHLRSESDQSKKARLVDLINTAGLPLDGTKKLHDLRVYRNRWVHVDEPWEDQLPLENPKAVEDELEGKATEAMRLLREVLYRDQWV